MKRKEFIKAAGITATAFAIGPAAKLFAHTAADTKVRLAIIGVGLRGQNHLDLVLRRDDVELVAICDIDDRMLKSSKEMITKSGKKMPAIITGDPYAWKKLFDIKGGLDAVLIATPWEWHKPMIMASLDAGIKYIGTEVILGITLQPLGRGKGRRKKQRTRNDAGKCMLPQGCDGGIEYGAAGIVRRADSFAGRLPARPA